MKRIDLHVHTSASDSTFSPTQTVQIARDSGLAAIAVTDHDNVSGVAEAIEAGKALGVEVVRGVEISTKYGGAVHILGYFIHSDGSKMQSVFDWMVHDRDERNEKICALMAADGLDVSYAEMKARFGTAIGRPHLAQVLVELGMATDMVDAFDRYVEKGRRYYLPRNFLPIEKCVETIREAGGIPVLAHPFQYKRDDSGLRELIELCVDHGLMGMECRYSGYDADMVHYLEALKDKYGLLETGGSDFHGGHKPGIEMGRGINGNLDVPYEFLEKLKDVKI